MGAKCALGRALSLKGRCIPSLLWRAAPIDVCISDEGVKGVRFNGGSSVGRPPVARLSAPGGGPEVAHGTRAPTPIA